RAPIRIPLVAPAGPLTSWETSLRLVEPGLGAGSSRFLLFTALFRSGTWTAVSVYRGGSARASRVVFGALAEHSFRSARAPTGAAEAAALPARFGDWRPDRADKAVRAPIRNPQCASASRLTSWETSVRSVETGVGWG